MKNLCSDNCPHGKTRKTCTELCLEAALYADQDYIGHERAFNIPGITKLGGAIQFRVPVTPEEKAKEASLLYRQGKSYKEISIHLECDEDFIREVLDEECS